MFLSWGLSSTQDNHDWFQPDGFFFPYTRMIIGAEANPAPCWYWINSNKPTEIINSLPGLTLGVKLKTFLDTWYLLSSSSRFSLPTETSGGIYAGTLMETEPPGVILQTPESAGSTATWRNAPQILQDHHRPDPPNLSSHPLPLRPHQWKVNWSTIDMFVSLFNFLFSH